MQSTICVESEGYAIPFNEVIRLIEFYPRGHPYRVGFTLMALTGCRCSEINNFGVNSFYGEWVIWKPAKKQGGMRKEKLPMWFLKDLELYLQKFPHCDDKLFPFDQEELRQVLNKRVRPVLGGAWLQKTFSRGCIKNEYVLQLRGLRHSWSSLDFYNNFLTWGATMAVEMTCKRMRHSLIK